MKAYMSLPGDGPEYFDRDSLAGVWALLEVRAILAESEPDRNTAHLTLRDHSTGSVPLFTRALADALAAFVAEGE